MPIVFGTLPTTGYVRVSDLCRSPRKPAHLAILPIGRATLWRWVKEGKFPAPVRLAGSTMLTVWPVETVQAWIAQQPSAQAPAPREKPKAALQQLASSPR